MSVAAEPVRDPSSLEIADYDYALPPELIAQSPLDRRDDSRLMVLEKASGVIHHSRFSELADWLSPGDLVIANNSRVIPARLRGARVPGGGQVEILLLRKSGDAWSALARPAKRLARGTCLTFPAQRPTVGPAEAVVEENMGGGEVRIRFEAGADQRLDLYGETPLPPYIAEPLSDVDRYQTVYGRIPGSAAAPTAGLHFTPEVIGRLHDRGIFWEELTLHVGVDTFRPVTVADARNHLIHSEWCDVPGETVHAIASCRTRGGRVIAVGTTSARTLESLGRKWGDAVPKGFTGLIDMFIVPGHRWTLVDAMVTNFHLPRSTLLLLVSALAGREPILRAYAEAIRHGYRFYSFGDAMLIV